MAIVGIVVALFLRRFPINPYGQVGLVPIIALAAKNTILIVEFARELRAEGSTAADAAVEPTRRRFRPILMTSIALILGVVPLLTATGAGAASQQAIGAVMFGGMLASTLLAIPSSRSSTWRSPGDRESPPRPERSRDCETFDLQESNDRHVSAPFSAQFCTSLCYLRHTRKAAAVRMEQQKSSFFSLFTWRLPCGSAFDASLRTGTTQMARAVLCLDASRRGNTWKIGLRS